MDYWTSKTFCAAILFCVCLSVIIKYTDSKDIDTYACYSDVPQCGRHSIKCPEGQTVVITNAQYAHLPRTMSCSRGKVSSCSARYTRSCCRPSGNECFSPYGEKDAKDLLRPCLGSRTCFHMTPQNNKMCAKYKLMKSSFSVVTHRCVLNEHLISYNTKKQITSDLVYLLYRIPTESAQPGTATVYGCDVTGPEGSKLKVKALDIGMTPGEGTSCSGLEVEKDSVVTVFSCNRKDLRFESTLYDGTVPVEVNIVDLAGRPPEAAWVLVEGNDNITVECGKIRETRTVKEQTTAVSDVPTESVILIQSSTSLSTSLSTSPPTSEITTSTSAETVGVSTISSTTEQEQNDVTKRSRTQGKVRPQPTYERTSTSTVVSTTTQPVTSRNGDNPVHTTSLETTFAVVSSSSRDRMPTYAGIGGGLFLLIVLIIIVTIICYRRKRYKRYQSRKIEEERNIPDGEERSCEKVDEDRGKAPSANKDDTTQGEAHKGDNAKYNSQLADSGNDTFSNETKRVKGRKEKGYLALSGSGTSPPRVSQPRDSDGYTNAGKPYGNEGASRDVTVEFYDNPGFKTTLENIKIPD